MLLTITILMKILHNEGSIILKSFFKIANYVILILMSVTNQC